MLALVALIVLLPVALTALYSFFSPEEIKAFMETRGNYDAAAWMEIKLAPRVFSLSQYYNIPHRGRIGAAGFCSIRPCTPARSFLARRW